MRRKSVKDRESRLGGLSTFRGTYLFSPTVTVPVTAPLGDTDHERGHRARRGGPGGLFAVRVPPIAERG